MKHQPVILPGTRDDDLAGRGMRILQVATYVRPGGGIQTHILDISAWLRARGHAVFLAGHGEDREYVAGERFTEVPLHEVSAFQRRSGALDALRRARALLRSVVALRRLIRRERIDLIHVHETAPLLAAWLATRGLGRPILYTFHGASADRLAGLARMARRMADQVISPSRTGIAQLVALGVPQERAQALGLAVKPLPPVDPEKVAALRAGLLGEGGTRLALSLSRYTEQKALDAMIRVARRAAEGFPGLRIAVGGSGPLEAELKALARAEGVEHVIRFVGLVKDAPLYLAAADLYLLTSRWEELPISIVEALRAGLPVIATDCGGVKELVDGSVGRLCAIDDEAALADALAALCADDELRGALGASALARSCEPRFSADHVYRSYEALYARALAERTGQ